MKSQLINTIISVSIMIIVGSVIGCADGDSPEPKDISNNNSGDNFIYICGNEWGTIAIPGTSSYYTLAAYWKNGVQTTLSPPTISTNDWFTKSWSIDVVDGKVYTAGSKWLTGNHEIAAYWINSDEHLLSNGDFHARGFDIAAHSSGVYVAGEENIGTTYESKYWKDGSGNPLVSEVTHSSTATGVAIDDDGNVYVAGADNNNGNALARIPRLWKNGSDIGLFAKEGKYYPGKIAIDGDDIYVAGYFAHGGDHKAIVWINGSYTTLSEGIDDAKAYDVAVYQGDVYVAGYIDLGSKDQAVYWKNGEMHPVNSPGTSRAKGIFVKNGDVYLVGHEGKAPDTKGKLWINGVSAEEYTQENASFEDVFVE